MGNKKNLKYSLKRTKSSKFIKMLQSQNHRKNSENLSELKDNELSTMDVCRGINSNTTKCTSANSSEPSAKNIDDDYLGLNEQPYIDENIDLPPLLVELDMSDKPYSLYGRRIVDIAHFVNSIIRLGNHGRTCTMGCYRLVKERRDGLGFVLQFHCATCGQTQFVYSEKTNNFEEINNSSVWAALWIGIGHRQFTDLLSIQDIPTLSEKKFKKHELVVGNHWQKHLDSVLKRNGEEEKKIALQKNNVINGIPYITVIGDGGWAKRSYGHGFNSQSGVATIIGAVTKKPLYVGVKNKYCSTCEVAKKSNKNIEHVCFKNYKGSSTGMEQEIIVEGFKKSIEQHGLMYKYYIGDGDSSVYTRIIENVPYGRDVIKLECANHITRNLHDGLRKLISNKHYPLKCRQLLGRGSPAPIERLVKGIRTAIKECGKTNDVQQLRKDLLNAPYHVLGRHLNCRLSYCKRIHERETDLVPLMESANFMVEINNLVNRVIRKSDRLVYNTTTNNAENFMSLVAKCNGGKRINFTKNGSFQRRVLAASQSYSDGPTWHTSPWKKMVGKSPGKYFKYQMKRREIVNSKRKNSSDKKSKRKLDFNKTTADDYDYGPKAAELDISETELKSKMAFMLEKLNEEAANQQLITEIEKKTIGQNDNIEWHEIRKNRLTASHFGAIITRRPNTPCHNLVKLLLYPKHFVSKHIEFGRKNENVALKSFEKSTSCVVKKCGFFIDGEHTFLGASPDGVINDDAIVEVKCAPSIENMSLLDAVKSKKLFCLELYQSQLRLKRQHPYYWQIQGQLNITKKSKCAFILYTLSNDIYVEWILKEVQLWNKTMLPKLISFYTKCMLPEIVDPRLPRGMTIRDPPNFKENLKRKHK